jgi:hypothetical protein
MFKGIRSNPANAQKIFFLFVSKGLLSKNVAVTAIDSMRCFKVSAYYCTEPKRKGLNFCCWHVLNKKTAMICNRKEQFPGWFYDFVCNGKKLKECYKLFY